MVSSNAAGRYVKILKNPSIPGSPAIGYQIGLVDGDRHIAYKVTMITNQAEHQPDYRLCIYGRTVSTWTKIYPDVGENDKREKLSHPRCRKNSAGGMIRQTRIIAEFVQTLTHHRHSHRLQRRGSCQLDHDKRSCETSIIILLLVLRGI